MEIRDAIDRERAGGVGTAGLRENFLVAGLFEPAKLNLVYTFYDG